MIKKKPPLLHINKQQIKQIIIKLNQSKIEINKDNENILYEDQNDLIGNFKVNISYNIEKNNEGDIFFLKREIPYNIECIDYDTFNYFFN